MKLSNFFLSLSFLLIGLNSQAQCDDLIYKSYDKFSKFTSITFLKKLTLDKGSITFKVEPYLNGAYLGIGFNIVNNSPYLSFGIANNFAKRVSVTILFDDNFTMNIDGTTQPFPITLSKGGGSTSSTLYCCFMPNPCCKTDEWSTFKENEENFKQHIRNIKISAIRFFGVSGIIDIDVPTNQQDYFINMYRCLE